MMRSYKLEDLNSQQAAGEKAYLEFLRVPDLSMGLYILPAGGTDPQSPHAEDEVYYVVSGSAHIKVGDDNMPVEAGSIIYVGKHIEHRFHSIQSDLTLLVFFAPAEYSMRPQTIDHGNGLR